MSYSQAWVAVGATVHAMFIHVGKEAAIQFLEFYGPGKAIQFGQFIYSKGWRLGTAANGAIQVITKEGGVATKAELELAAAQFKEAGSLAATVVAIARKKAGFAEKGIPLIIDNNNARKGLAEALRARGYNVRTVQEIFGSDPGDAAIAALAETIGGRVLTRNIKDFGRIIGMEIDARATTVDTWIRIIQMHIPNY